MKTTALYLYLITGCVVGITTQSQAVDGLWQAIVYGMVMTVVCVLGWPGVLVYQWVAL